MNISDKSGLSIIPGLCALLLYSFGACSSGSTEQTDASGVDSASPDTSVSDGSLPDSWRPDSGTLDVMVSVDVIGNSDISPEPDVDGASDAASNSDVTVGALDVMVSVDVIVNPDISPEPDVASDAAFNSDVTVGFDAVDCSDPDGDGYGQGEDCLGSDCDETARSCWSGPCCSEPQVWLPELTSVLEDAGSVEICIHRSAPLDRTETVQISTKQLELGTGAGVHPAASAVTDYVGFFEALSFSVGESTVCFNLSIIDDALVEGDEELGLGILSAQFSTIAPGQNWTDDPAVGLPRVVIVEDDSAICVDSDNDGYGQGDSCLGSDCDDGDISCWTGTCCPSDCTDGDGDGYGQGSDCLGTDCNESNINCWTGDCCPESTVFFEDNFDSYSDSPLNHGWSVVESNIHLEDGVGYLGSRGAWITYTSQGTTNNWFGFSIENQNTLEVYVRFRFKIEGVPTGIKFLKIFGKINDPEGYANATFPTGSITRGVAMGSGDEIVNDTNQVYLFEGRCSGDCNLESPATFLVTTGQGSYYNDGWHTYEGHVKFNDDDQYNGEIDVWIDSVHKMSVRGVKNRNNNNSHKISSVQLANYCGADYETPFTVYYDDVQASTSPIGP